MSRQLQLLMVLSRTIMISALPPQPGDSEPFLFHASQWMIVPTVAKVLGTIVSCLFHQLVSGVYLLVTPIAAKTRVRETLNNTTHFGRLIILRVLYLHLILSLLISSCVITQQKALSLPNHRHFVKLVD